MPRPRTPTEPTLPPSISASLYGEMVKVADRQLRRSSGPQSIDASDLVNEAWLRLRRHSKLREIPREEFIKYSAQVVHRLLIDRARRRMAQRRGGGLRRDDLHDGIAAEGLDAGQRAADVIDLDAALRDLAVRSELQAKIVQMRFVEGYSSREVAEALGVGTDRVKRETRFARAWLARALCRNCDPEIGGSSEGEAGL